MTFEEEQEVHRNLIQPGIDIEESKRKNLENMRKKEEEASALKKQEKLAEKASNFRVNRNMTKEEEQEVHRNLIQPGIDIEESKRKNLENMRKKEEAAALEKTNNKKPKMRVITKAELAQIILSQWKKSLELEE
jgi:hypothetical protein